MVSRQCARAKIHKHTHSKLQPIQVPKRKFVRVHVDLVGPFPTSSEGYTHIFMMVDITTRWGGGHPSILYNCEGLQRSLLQRLGEPFQGARSVQGWAYKT